MADIVTLIPRKGDPEIVDALRRLGSEALNGRITGFAIVYLDADGAALTQFNMPDTLEAIGLVEWLKTDLLANWRDDD
ncbi:MAG: hypothetical protein ABIO40_08325 [Devosia sp.]